MKKSKINRQRNTRKVVKHKIINYMILCLTIILSLGSMTVYAQEDDTLVIHIKIVTEPVSEPVEETSSQTETDVAINPTSRTITQDPLDTLSEEELYFFAECVEIEAEAEGLEGKLAVANVLINRKNSESFPSTYKDVVSEYSNGTYQFSSYSGHSWGEKKVTEETYEAIRMALNGENNVGNATYFCNLNECGGGWFTTAENSGKLLRVVTIGLHTFFATPN